MSARALTWAWEQHTKSSGERLVLLVLADRADDDGYCWPSARWIAAKALLDEGTVRRHLTAMCGRGLLTRERRRRPDGSLSTYDYWLSIPERFSSVGPPSQRASTPGRPAGAGARAEPSISYIEKSTSGHPRPLVPLIGSDDAAYCDTCGVRGGRHRYDCPQKHHAP